MEPYFIYGYNVDSSYRESIPNKGIKEKKRNCIFIESPSGRKYMKEILKRWLDCQPDSFDAGSKSLWRNAIALANRKEWVVNISRLAYFSKLCCYGDTDAVIDRFIVELNEDVVHEIVHTFGYKHKKLVSDWRRFCIGLGTCVD